MLGCAWRMAWSQVLTIWRHARTKTTGEQIHWREKKLLLSIAHARRRLIRGWFHRLHGSRKINTILDASSRGKTPQPSHWLTVCCLLCLVVLLNWWLDIEKYWSTGVAAFPKWLACSLSVSRFNSFVVVVFLLFCMYRYRWFVFMRGWFKDWDLENSHLPLPGYTSVDVAHTKSTTRYAYKYLCFSDVVFIHVCHIDVSPTTHFEKPTWRTRVSTNHPPPPNMKDSFLSYLNML